MTFPVFASGDVLNASDMNAVGLWLVKTQTIGSAVSSVTVTGAFSSDYENYLITLNGGSASTAMDLNLTLGSTATGYYWGILFRTYAGSSSGASGSNTTSFLFGSGQPASLVANCTVSSPNLAKNTHFVTHYGGAATTSAGSVCGGYLADTTQYTAFTLTTSTGTITGGTIRVYGYRN